MATICEQSKLILEHPFFNECLEKANRNDMSGFERLFYEMSAHIWEKCSLQASRTYGNWHRSNHCLVKKELRDMPPPTNLDLRLPFVQPKPQSRTQVFKTNHKHIRLQVNNPNQLLITFTVENY
jgi:hypothetical protein